MKTRALVAGLLMAAGLSTLTLSAPAPAVGQTAEIGRIKSVVGTAQVWRGQAASPAAPGRQLLVSDVLTTGSNGRIGVTFVDNSRFAIGPNSRVALSQFEFDDTTHRGKSLTTVDRGSLGVVSGQIAKENKDAMKVRTPTSLLAARGTTFVVDVP
ncbi:FecR family protein [Phenylobacterium sp.]|jgi:hypothetical protein|uniref:FecR family protein n=1 Tax=Phenylobacterium sp. TaxID=1871053 RepID=UPI002ED9041F